MRGALFILIFPSALLASDAKLYKEGEGFASQNQVGAPKDAGGIPGYKGENVPEAKLSEGGLQDALTLKLKEKDNAATLIIKTHDERFRFKIDPSKDPIFKESDAILKDPLQTLQAEAEESFDKEEIVKTTHTCLEGGEPYLVTRKKELTVKTVQKSREYLNTLIAGSKFTRYWVSGNPQYTNKYSAPYGHDGQYRMTVKDQTYPDINWRFFDGCNWYYHSVQNNYKYTKAFEGESKKEISKGEFESKSLKNEDVKEVWSNPSEDMEQKIDQGLCSYVGKKCTKGSEARLINGFSITRPCWEETLFYECSAPQKNTCEDLKAKGCVQIGSTCKEKIGDTCVLYEQTYECVTRQGGGKKITLKGKVPYCLDGNCTSQDYESNKDIMEALSKLMIFKEIQKDMDKTPTIFKGETYGCDRNCIDFRDCCGSGKGWGVSLGLAGCSEKEKALAKLRGEKKCVMVGTYCAEKVLGVCIRKRTHFCCFGTKMARLIHEQGRPQLGMGFGDAKNPQCQGFTVEELSKLDFEKINLSELLVDMYSRFKAPNLQKLSEDFQQDWKNRMPKIEQDKQPPLQTVKESTKDATF